MNILEEVTIEFASVIDTTEVDRNIVNSVKRIKLDMSDIVGLVTDGSGSKFLSDSGEYKTVDGGVEGDYYRLDGTEAITGAFAGGNQVFKDASDAVDAQDLTTLSQVEGKLEIGVYNRPSRYAQNNKG